MYTNTPNQANICASLFCNRPNLFTYTKLNRKFYNYILKQTYTMSCKTKMKCSADEQVRVNNNMSLISKTILGGGDYVR